MSKNKVVSKFGLKIHKRYSLWTESFYCFNIITRIGSYLYDFNKLISNLQVLKIHFCARRSTSYVGSGICIPCPALILTTVTGSQFSIEFSTFCFKLIYSSPVHFVLEFLALRWPFFVWRTDFVALFYTYIWLHTMFFSVWDTIGISYFKNSLCQKIGTIQEARHSVRGHFQGKVSADTF